MIERLSTLPAFLAGMWFWILIVVFWLGILWIVERFEEDKWEETWAIIQREEQS